MDLASGGLGDADDVSNLDAAGAEEALVSEVLGGKVSDGELGEDDVGAGGDAFVEL